MSASPHSRMVQHQYGDHERLHPECPLCDIAHLEMLAKSVGLTAAEQTHLDKLRAKHSFYLDHGTRTS